MDSDWVSVYSNTSLSKVQLLKHSLENEGIPAIILNQKDSAHIHLGDIKLYVKRENVIVAKHLIESIN